MALACVACGAVASAAFAADSLLGEVDDIEYWQDSATATAPNAAFTVVSCPAGTEVSGGGFSQGVISGIPNDLGPIDTDPNDKPDDGFELTMTFESGTQTGSAVAICAPWNSRYDTVAVTARSGKSKRVDLYCRPGQSATGGGAQLTGAAGEAYINSSYPIDSSDAGTKPDDGWRVRAYNEAGPDKLLRLAVICTKEKVSYRREASTLGPGSSSGITPECPSAKHVVGGGIRLRGPASSGVLHALRPRDLGDGDTVPDDDVLGNGENESGSPGPKQLTVFAVCG